MNVITPVGERVTAPYRVGNFGRGSSNMSLSSQWRTRPDDERFLSLDDLRAFLAARSERSWTQGVTLASLKVLANRDDHDSLALLAPDGRHMTPTNWAFSQLCRQVGAPAGHYARLPGPIAALPLQYLLSTDRGELAKFYGTELEGVGQLRAVTSPTYGRVMDLEIVDAVHSIIDDTWKVPGMLDWGTMLYNPDHPVSKDTTTLYASDRDVFVMLVRDQYPIEVGKLPSGEPDLMFPGFIISNSETGSRSITGEFFMMRGICCNRIIWGSEGYQSFRIIHRENAPVHFERARITQMQGFTQRASSSVLRRITSAQNTIVAGNSDEQVEFLQKLDFSRKAANAILEQFEAEEGHPLASAWDVVNAITAHARHIPHQDERIEVERLAGKVLSRVTVDA